MTVADIRLLPKAPRKDDDEGCAFCHPNYECHGKGFETLSCPRVIGFQFLPYEDSYEEWSIQAVQFRDYDILGEVDLGTVEDDG
jgi:hypothetical protein